jgi:hypothetical protein
VAVFGGDQRLLRKGERVFLSSAREKRSRFWVGISLARGGEWEAAWVEAEALRCPGERKAVRRFPDMAVRDCVESVRGREWEVRVGRLLLSYVTTSGYL